MAGTKIQPTTERGGRKLTDEARAKLSATNKARYAAMTDEQRAAQLARIGRSPKAADPPPADSPPPPSGGPRNPLDDAPGASRGPRPQPQGRVGAPPVFRVPDLPPMDLGGEPAGDPSVEPTTLEGTPFGVSEQEIGDLLAMPFNFLAIRRGKHWKLLPDEVDTLAGPLARKINENALAARGLAMAGDWIVIIGGLGLVLWVRLEEDNRRAAAARSDGPSQGRGSPTAGDGDRGDGARRDHPGGDFRGRLNGVPLGASSNGHAPADGPEDPIAPLVQAL